jgi:hypothetical protein
MTQYKRYFAVNTIKPLENKNPEWAQVLDNTHTDFPTLEVVDGATKIDETKCNKMGFFYLHQSNPTKIFFTEKLPDFIKTTNDSHLSGSRLTNINITKPSNFSDGVYLLTYTSTVNIDINTDESNKSKVLESEMQNILAAMIDTAQEMSNDTRFLDKDFADEEAAINGNAATSNTNQPSSSSSSSTTTSSSSSSSSSTTVNSTVPTTSSNTSTSAPSSTSTSSSSTSGTAQSPTESAVLDKLDSTTSSGGGGNIVLPPTITTNTLTSAKAQPATATSAATAKTSLPGTTTQTMVLTSHVSTTTPPSPPSSTNNSRLSAAANLPDTSTPSSTTTTTTTTTSVTAPTTTKTADITNTRCADNADFCEVASKNVAIDVLDKDTMDALNDFNATRKAGEAKINLANVVRREGKSIPENCRAYDFKCSQATFEDFVRHLNAYLKNRKYQTTLDEKLTPDKASSQSVEQHFTDSLEKLKAAAATPTTVTTATPASTTAPTTTSKSATLPPFVRSADPTKTTAKRPAEAPDRNTTTTNPIDVPSPTSSH